MDAGRAVAQEAGRCEDTGVRSVDTNRLFSLFERLVSIESPSWREGSAARFCAHELEDLGFEVTFDASAKKTGSDTGNLIAHRAGTADGALMLSAHMDTVKPCEGITVMRIEDERGEVFCSGGDTILSADDKAGIAAIFEGVRAAVEAAAPRPDITVLLTTCEEQSLLGSSALAEDALVWPDDVPAASRGTEYEALLNAAGASGALPLFVLDADGAPGSLIMGAPYHWTLRARIRGRAAHAGVEPECGISAIQIASAAVTAMPLGRIDECTTANVGRIEGGVAVNIVPAAVTLEGECRSLYEDRVLAQRDAMTRALEEAAAQFGGTVEVAWELDYPAVVHEPGDALVAHLEAAAAACGLAIRHAISGGGADANVLGAKGADAITLGIGMTNFHSVDEYIEVADLQNMARYVEAIIEEYAK